MVALAQQVAEELFPTDLCFFLNHLETDHLVTSVGPDAQCGQDDSVFVALYLPSLSTLVGGVRAGGEQNLDVDSIDNHHRWCIIQGNLSKPFHFLFSYIGQMLNRFEAEYLTKTQVQDLLEIILRQTQSVEV